MDDGYQNELWRSRRDLQMVADGGAHRERWCVFDPLNRQSYRIGAVEHWFLVRARVPVQTGRLVDEFLSLHSAYSGDRQSLLSLLQRLQQTGLISRQATNESSLTTHVSPTTMWGWLSKLVAWQVRGVNPEKWLSFLGKRSGFLFARRNVLFWLSLACMTLSAVLLDLDRLLQEMGSFEWILSPNASGGLFVVFVLTRAIHELGHGLVCTRFGIRAPDLGVFFVLGAPCVYCDVSESWKLVDRRQRAAVAAAGMYAELLVAMLAAWLWLATWNGPIHILSMQTMLVCSLGTMLININPLMKFDGYYILADYLDETNLRGRADAVTVDAFRNWFRSGVRTPSSLSWQRRYFLIAFSWASAVYRIVLSITVAGVLLTLFGNWKLAWIGRFLAIAILCSWWGSPVVKLLSFAKLQFRRPLRALTLSAAIGAAIAVFCLIPIPNHQFASGWVEPLHAQGIYAPATGQLAESWIASGDGVVAGQPLLRLASNDTELRLVGIQREVARREVQLIHSTFARESHSETERDISDPEVARQNQLLLADAKAQRDRLNVLAPMAGQLIAFPASEPTGPLAKEVSSSVTSTMQYNWCDPSQIGRTVRQGTLLAAICGSGNQAVVILDKSQLAEIIVGSHTRLQLTQQPDTIVQGTVSSIVELSQRDSMWRPKTNHYEVAGQSSDYAAIIELPPTATSIPGGKVEAVFIGPATSLAVHMRRWLQSNLKQLAD